MLILFFLSRTLSVGAVWRPRLSVRSSVFSHPISAPGPPISPTQPRIKRCRTVSIFFSPRGLEWRKKTVWVKVAGRGTRHFGVLEDEMDRLLANLFAVPLEKINAWTRPGRFLSGAEIVAAGLAQMVDLFSGD